MRLAMVERELQDWEFPEPDEEDEGSETRPCSQCGAAIYEDTPRCPVCGSYLVHPSHRVLADRPWWFVLLAVAGVVATVIWLMR